MDLASNNVGGITFDAQGVVKDGQRQVSDQLGKLRGDIPDGFGEGLELRKISLRDLQTAIVAARNNGEGGNLPQSLLFMGGLQRIQYVFVYPDDHDIVLAGPGEGWQLDDWGNAVGVTTVVYVTNEVVLAEETYCWFGICGRITP